MARFQILLAALALASGQQKKDQWIMSRQLCTLSSGSDCEDEDDDCIAIIATIMMVNVMINEIDDCVDYDT